MNHEGIKEIQLVLENCESITVPREFILAITFTGYKRAFRRLAINSIDQIETYDNVLIEIDEKIRHSEDARRGLFETMFKSDPSYIAQEERPLLDLIKSRTDITGIDVIYEDHLKSKNFSFYPVWSGSDYDNDYASYSSNSSEDLLLVISSGEDTEFNEFVETIKTESNDKKQQDYRKKMYSI